MVARTEVELVDSACIAVRGSDIGGVELRCTLLTCIVVSEGGSVRFVGTCTGERKKRRIHEEESSTQSAVMRVAPSLRAS